MVCLLKRVLNYVAAPLTITTTTTRSASVDGVIYSFTNVNGEMKVQETAMSAMPFDDEESETEINGNDHDSFFHSRRGVSYPTSGIEIQHLIDEEESEEEIDNTTETAARHTGERKLEITEKYNAYLEMKEQIRATASISSEGGISFPLDDISQLPIGSEANNFNRDLQGIKEISVMVLWTPQAMCNYAKGMDSCDTTESKSITMMEDLVTLAVEETVSSILSKTDSESNLYSHTIRISCT
jgi:hypothetical protein